MGSPKGARLEKTRVCVLHACDAYKDGEGAGVWASLVFPCHCVCVCVCVCVDGANSC